MEEEDILVRSVTMWYHVLEAMSSFSSRSPTSGRAVAAGAAILLSLHHSTYLLNGLSFVETSLVN